MFYQLLSIIFVCLITILQVSFVPVLPFPASAINLIIVSAVLGLFLYRFDKVLLYMLIAGFLLDINSWYFFGLEISAIFLTLFITQFFLDKFFTNKSIYSIAVLMVIATLIYEFYKSIVIFVAGAFSQQTTFTDFYSLVFFQNAATELAANSVILIILFYTANYFTNAFNSVFLKKGA
ncbi:MAG: hypothetical protein Q8Q23_00150 [bacterium]|nr:hypothetical protein [bacterium]